MVRWCMGIYGPVMMTRRCESSASGVKILEIELDQLKGFSGG